MSTDSFSWEHGAADNEAPPGWTILHPEDPFNQTNGPFFVSEDFQGGEEEPARLGFRVRPHNCSFAGFCHGAVLASVLDNALGHCVQVASGAAHTPTISLNVDFVSAAAEGEWLESRVRIIRKTRSLVFADAVLLGECGITARASGIFKLPKQP
jgi:acyl-coenzyme A thioesterase PaaI-like protein